MALPAALADTLAWWSTYYGDHHVVSVTTRFVHLASMMIGGGAALREDRAILRGRRSWTKSGILTLNSIKEAHLVVLVSMVFLVGSGVLMTAADSETFLHSKLFWAKMLAFGVLVANGAGLAAAEKAAREHAGEAAPARLIVTALVSMAFWVGLVLLGAWLTVAA